MRSRLGVACFNTEFDFFSVSCFQDVVGCNTTPVEGAESGDDSLVYLCSALSGDDGAFVFPSLASGEYTVVRMQNSLLIATSQNFFWTQSYIAKNMNIY